MRRSILIAMVAACGGGNAPAPKEPTLPPDQPVATRRAEPPRPARPWPATHSGADADTVFDTKLPDPYRWLENEKSDEVQAWMKAQDDYARGELSKLPARSELATRLAKL